MSRHPNPSGRPSKMGISAVTLGLLIRSVWGGAQESAFLIRSPAPSPIIPVQRGPRPTTHQLLKTGVTVSFSDNC